MPSARDARPLREPGRALGRADLARARCADGQARAPSAWRVLLRARDLVPRDAHGARLHLGAVARPRVRQPGAHRATSNSRPGPSAADERRGDRGSGLWWPWSARQFAVGLGRVSAMRRRAAPLGAGWRSLVAPRRHGPGRTAIARLHRGAAAPDRSGSGQSLHGDTSRVQVQEHADAPARLARRQSQPTWQ